LCRDVFRRKSQCADQSHAPDDPVGKMRCAHSRLSLLNTSVPLQMGSTDGHHDGSLRWRKWNWMDLIH
jgi:hypothetical protein